MNTRQTRTKRKPAADHQNTPQAPQTARIPQPHHPHAASAPSPHWPARHPFFAATLLALLTALVYFPVRHAGFVWDDGLAIQKNPLLRSLDGLVAIWTTTNRIPTEAHYWPLTYTTLWLDRQLWGENPLGYHLVNLLWHVANTLLVWRLLARLRLPGAWLAALLFGIHPIHVESVAWVIERKDVLSGFFYLSALLCFIRSEERGGALLETALAIAAFICAMLSKSVSITLPFALLIWLWWREGRLTARHLRRVVPFLLIAILFGALDSIVYARNSTWQYKYDFLQRILLAANSFWVYARQILWPDLAVIHPRWTVNPYDWRLYPALLAALALLPAMWHLRHRYGRAPLALTLFYGLTLGPTLGLVGFEYLEQAYVADRFQYLACIGPIALLAAGLLRAVPRPPAAAAAFAVFALFLGALTWRQVGFYRSDETLFARALSHNPESASALGNLGTGLLKQGQWQQAERYLRQAVKLKPDSGLYHNNLGFVLQQQGRHAEAIREIRLGLKKMLPQEEGQSPWPQAMAGLAWYLATYPDPALRDPSEAMRLANRAIELTRDPNPNILDTLAAAHAAAGQFDMACQVAGSALQRAQGAGMPALAGQIAARLEGYRKRQAYIDESIKILGNAPSFP